MDFDASPQSLRTLGQTLRKDQRVVRWTVLKQGEKVEDVLALRGKTAKAMDEEPVSSGLLYPNKPNPASR